MNTRLQVEHPVTEEITGLDIVEEQLKIASGERLTITRETLKRNGHAIEVRIYAEDPKTFLPSPGKITAFRLPEGEGIRNETAVEAGSKVPPFYDPMIAKLIAWGSSREEACKRIRDALLNYQVEGIKTNIPMLIDTVSHEQFLKGYTTTHFVNDFLKQAESRK